MEIQSQVLLFLKVVTYFAFYLLSPLQHEWVGENGAVQLLFFCPIFSFSFPYSLSSAYLLESSKHGSSGLLMTSLHRLCLQLGRLAGRDMEHLGFRYFDLICEAVSVLLVDS